MSEVLLTIELDEDGNLVLVNPEGYWIALSDKDTQNLLDIVYSDSGFAHESWERVAKRIREEAEVMDFMKMILTIKRIKDTQLIEKYPQVLADVFHKPIKPPRGFRDVPAVDPDLMLDISEIAAEVNGKKLEDLSPEEFFETFFILHDLYFEMKKRGEVNPVE